MGKDHGVVNNERVTVRNVAYRQLHSHLTLHYWAYNTKRIVPTYIDVVAWKHAEKVTQFSSSATLEEEENERIGFSSNPEQILLFFYRFSLRFRRDASQSRFQSRELTDRVNPNKFQEFSFRQLPSPPSLSNLVQRYRSRRVLKIERMENGEIRERRIIGKSEPSLFENALFVNSTSASPSAFPDSR